MKSSLEHLHQLKKDELEKIVSVIRKHCSDVGKIILFGSYARGNYKEEGDPRITEKSGHVSDYDIFVVTEKKESALDSTLWYDVTKELQKTKFTAYPKVLIHDIEELNRKLSQGQYFFSDIKKEGILLFDAKKFEIGKIGTPTSEEMNKIAKNHFDEWFTTATDFSYHHKIAMDRQSKEPLEISFKRAAFFLHQAAESAYKCALLVLSNYTPREHFLEVLGKRAEKLEPRLKNIFHKDSEEEKTRFELLEYAYIGGRYDPHYYISQDDLKILAKDVEKLLSVVEEVCKERIR